MGLATGFPLQHHHIKGKEMKESNRQIGVLMTVTRITSSRLSRWNMRSHTESCAFRIGRRGT